MRQLSLANVATFETISDICNGEFLRSTFLTVYIIRRHI